MPVLERPLLARFGLEGGVLDKLDDFAARVLETNTRFNLTAITSPPEVTVKHFADSLSLLPLLPPEGGALLDVGTGAGFPGMVIAIAAPQWRVTLLDATRKKVDFLRETAAALAVDAEVVWGRAEELGRPGGALRERFDVVTARAVAAMPLLCRWCLPLLRPGGRLLAMKGAAVEPCDRELIRCGGRLLEVRELPGLDMSRRVAVIKKQMLDVRR